MAETMTYDAGTDTVTTSSTLNSDEQDSLEVGESMEAEQNSLLAGKYKDAQELEKAYVELQGKLGEKESKQEVESEPEPEVKEEPKEESNILDQLWDQATSGNDYDKETVEALGKMSATELANMHLEYRNSIEKQSKQQPAQQELSKTDVERLQSIVGGESNYKNMMDWANKTLNEEDISLFDSVMDKGDPASAFFAVNSLASRYNDAVGFDGNMLSGKPPSNSTDVYRSQQEVVQAMSDPRYERDPAYRQDIMDKLERSDLKF
tara:strand:- start:279 stop:1070 length:792 start_codon:yes stop_codon:yes gene_type:complete